MLADRLAGLLGGGGAGVAAIVGAANNTVEKVEVRTITLVRSAGSTPLIRVAWSLAGANSQFVPVTHGNTMRQADLSCAGGNGLLALAAPGSHQLLGARLSRCANNGHHLLPRWLLAPPATQERLAQSCFPYRLSPLGGTLHAVILPEESYCATMSFCTPFDWSVIVGVIGLSPIL